MSPGLRLDYFPEPNNIRPEDIHAEHAVFAKYLHRMADGVFESNLPVWVNTAAPSETDQTNSMKNNTAGGNSGN